MNVEDRDVVAHAQRNRLVDDGFACTCIHLRVLLKYRPFSCSSSSSPRSPVVPFRS